MTIAILLSLLSACGLFKASQVSPTPVPSPDAKYADQDLDSLLAYGDELAKLNKNDRWGECKHLQELGQADQNLGWVLHLMLIQAIIEDCGDRRETLSKLKFIMSLVKDVHLRQYIALHEQILLLLENKIEVTKLLNHQLKISKQEIQKSHHEIKTRKNEINTRENEIKTRKNEMKTHDNERKTLDNEMKRLQNKLDLLKSIEPNLGNSPQETNENSIK